jgi:IS605 OrfB family transposase
MLEQRKYCGEGSIGHGVHTRIKPIEVMSDKIANFRDTCNHKYSRYVVDMAVKHKCGVIQMEDLTGISKDEVFLKNWSYYDLQQKIEYKAKEVGINVKYIKPQYTSQRCSKCGHIHKDNRKAQAEFECQVCGFKTNADYNAARNIATPDIDKIIEQQLKGKSVED